MKITRRWDGVEIFADESPTIRETLEAAVKSGANLGSAYLVGANLGSANLGGANLGGAYLGGAKLVGANLGGAKGKHGPIVWASCGWNGHGECGRTLLGIVDAFGATHYQCGCFRGSESDLRDYIANGAAALRASRTLAADFVATRLAEGMRR